MNIEFTATDFFVLKPAILLCLFGCGILITDFFLDARQKVWNAVTALIGLGFTAYAVWQHQAENANRTANGLPELTGLSGAVTVDGFGIFFNWIFIIATALAIIISTRYLEIEQEHHGEYYSLLLFAQTGMVFLAYGTELVTLFIGLELMALSFYVMVGFLRGDRRSNEAALKYLLLGAFSSGLLAYGFSILYGIANSTKLSEIASAIALREPRDPMVFLAMATTAVGLFFKIAAAPFHMWAPDAYEGAPTTITAYLSVASKAASFAFLLRIFQTPLESVRPTWEPLVGAVALLTMTIGNLAAISQTNIKRLLAYSSISHAGYILLGLVSGNQTGLNGISVYILVYTFMNFGAFTMVVAMRNKNIIGDEIDDMSGLMFRRPTYAILMLIFLLSLAGIPPTAGFLGKYYIFLSLIQTRHYYLAVFAVLYVAVAAYYYFRIVKVMFVSEAPAEGELADGVGVRVALAVTGAFTLVIGLYPEPFLQIAQRSLLAALQ